MIEKNKIVILFFGVALLSLVLFYFVGNKDDNAGVVPIFTEETRFSRITFFNSQAQKASLEIPEEWEGSYRIVENGGLVKFVSIIDPNRISDLFLIKIFTIDEWQKENGSWQFLIEKNKHIFAYQLSTAVRVVDENNKKYNEMLIQSSELLKSFKTN